MHYIRSPMNYSGGKYKLLNTIIPALPEKIDKFVDLFLRLVECRLITNYDISVFSNDTVRQKKLF